MTASAIRPDLDCICRDGNVPSVALFGLRTDVALEFHERADGGTPILTKAPVTRVF